MSFLDNLKKAQFEDILPAWKALDSVDQLAQLVVDSYVKPVAIFKHSTSCGVSAQAKFKLEQAWDIDPQNLDFYYLDLLQNRAVSNQIATELGVTHQSPQLIILKDGQPIFHTSHHRISLSGLHNVLA
jgi:bacillithiol system protein YtxJ